ncbi:hypothetical protein CP09DC77_1044 [Chlamydia psittaci 09DC77]|nr:hypothetical protein CP09DC77_1044 [Chlamydia psittaci 09DC77]
MRKDLKVDSFNLSIIYLPKTRSSSSRNKKILIFYYVLTTYALVL